MDTGAAHNAAQVKGSPIRQIEKEAQMKRIITIAFLGISIIGLLSGFSWVSESQIVGKWASDARSKGGLGARYNFTKDGVVMSSFGALVDFDYQIEGQTLTHLPQL